MARDSSYWCSWTYSIVATSFTTEWTITITGVCTGSVVNAVTGDTPPMRSAGR
jgi:hypothetical protein